MRRPNMSLYGVRNLWLQDDTMKVYVRKGFHILSQGQRVSVTLDIAAVEVEEEKRGQGYWNEFLTKAHEMNPWDATFIECVHNPRLAASLIRHGWINVPSNMPGRIESFFLPKDIDKYYNQLLLKQKFNPVTFS